MANVVDLSQYAKRKPEEPGGNGKEEQSQEAPPHAIATNLLCKKCKQEWLQLFTSPVVIDDTFHCEHCGAERRLDMVEIVYINQHLIDRAYSLAIMGLAQRVAGLEQVARQLHQMVLEQDRALQNMIELNVKGEKFTRK